jgi:peptidyl-prolyl cis-trans isomerase SurA|tara:strand:+ start:1701 stop:2618 length:918 start_codon:yes stop_codon:yes gene_type:complete
MKILISILILLMTLSSAQSIETRIVHVIQDEVITNIDIKNEFKYLLALNNRLKELDKEQIFTISNESIIREKIKKIELLKNFKTIEINSEYLSVVIKDTYLRLKLKTLNDFKLYLKDYNLLLSDIEKKITIDILWNELIIQKYSRQITINEDKIKKEIINNIKKEKKEYQLSEIIFEIKNKNEIKKKYNEIAKSINEIGFKNSASIYSIADTSKIGGDIGWINESLLNNQIKKSISNLKIGELSEPIILSSGILILKISDIKTSQIKIDQESEFKKAVNYERNRQLNQYSKIYYNKIKKNLEFNE